MFQTVIRAVRLNLLPLTRSKCKLLDELSKSVSTASNLILSIFESSKPISFSKLHQFSYKIVREKFNVQCQVLIEAIHRVWENRGRAKKFSKPSVDFNVPRSGRLVETKRGNPIIAIASFKGVERVGLPVKRDGAWQRFKALLVQGYSFSQFRLMRRGGSWVVIVNLRREVVVEEPELRQAIVSIDVGTACLASISVVCQSKVLRQLYFGRDVAQKQRDICVRRSKLQSRADRKSSKAKRMLQKLRGYERNFVQTRCYQVAHQIVELAKQYRAAIAIENLSKLNDIKLRRKVNRKVRRMPYRKFRIALESVAWQNGIQVIAVKARNTSKACSKCGREGIRNLDNWTWFKCPSCGFQANADRNASVNIALRLTKLLSERRVSQTSESERAVTHAICPDEGPQRMLAA